MIRFLVLIPYAFLLLMRVINAISESRWVALGLLSFFIVSLIVVSFILLKHEMYLFTLLLLPCYLFLAFIAFSFFRLVLGW